MDYCVWLGRFRFIAVTRPIQYAKHRSTYRVPLTVVLTWVVSILISSPIVLGANYTERRSEQDRSLTTKLHLHHFIAIHLGRWRRGWNFDSEWSEAWPRRERRQRAPVGVTDAVHLLQRRLHYLLVNGFVLHALCGDAAAVLEDIPRHQRPRPSQSSARRAGVILRHGPRNHGTVAAAAHINLASSN